MSVQTKRFQLPDIARPPFTAAAADVSSIARTSPSTPSPPPPPLQKQQHTVEQADGATDGVSAAASSSTVEVSDRTIARGTGVSVARYRAKLEECAALHDGLQRAMEELRRTTQLLQSQEQVQQSLRDEVDRLHGVVQMVTAELHGKQERVHALEQANWQLSSELTALRAHPAGPPPLASTAPTAVSGPLVYSLVASPPMRQGGVPSPIPSTYGTTHPVQRETVRDAEFAAERYGQSQWGTQSGAGSVHDDTTTAVSAREDGDGPASSSSSTEVHALLTAYTVECFRCGTTPHPQLLYSLYHAEDGCAVMESPAASFAQLTVLHRLLLLLSSPSSTAPSASWTPSLAPFQVFARTKLRALSLRCADVHSGVSVLAQMIPLLPLLKELEVFAVSSTVTMQRLSEALAFATQVELLSLPELAVDDAALELLWQLLRQREQQHQQKRQSLTATADVPLRTNALSGGTLSSDSKAASMSVNGGASGGGGVGPREVCVLRVDTLNLTACHIADTLTLKRLHCPGLEVLLLAGAEALTDAGLHHILTACPALHTLDVSGCVQLTTSSVRFFNDHPNVVVLRAERCPLLQKLELHHVQVLYSALHHATTLVMPSLQRLPVPITQRTALHRFVAPRLEEITLHGMVVDGHTLPAQLMKAMTDAVVAMDEEERNDTAVPPTELPADAEADPELQPVSSNREVKPEEDDTEGMAAPHNASGDEKDPQDPAVNVTKEASVDDAHDTAVSALRWVAFTDCTFTEPTVLAAFLRAQNQLERLSLHGCRGVTDEDLQALPKTLRELDLSYVATLSDAGLRSVVTRAPGLTRLQLKAAGSRITDGGLHALYGLTELRELNLLELNVETVSGPTVAALAASLPHLAHLFHETAVVSHGAAPSAETAGSDAAPTFPAPVAVARDSFLRVDRVDDEGKQRNELDGIPRELLRLRGAASLALWRESLESASAHPVAATTGASAAPHTSSAMVSPASAYGAAIPSVGVASRFTKSMANPSSPPSSVASLLLPVATARSLAAASSASVTALRFTSTIPPTLSSTTVRTTQRSALYNETSSGGGGDNHATALRGIPLPQTQSSAASPPSAEPRANTFTPPSGTSPAAMHHPHHHLPMPSNAPPAAAEGSATWSRTSSPASSTASPSKPSSPGPANARVMDAENHRGGHPAQSSVNVDGRTAVTVASAVMSYGSSPMDAAAALAAAVVAREEAEEERRRRLLLDEVHQQVLEDTQLGPWGERDAVQEHELQVEQLRASSSSVVGGENGAGSGGSGGGARRRTRQRSVR